MCSVQNNPPLFCRLTCMQGYFLHGAPQPDPSVSLSLSDASSGAPVSSSVCPGTTYNLTLTFPMPQHYLYTVPANFSLSQPLDASCPNRAGSAYDYVNNQLPPAVPSTTDQVRVPCGAAVPLTIVSRSAGSEFDYYHAASFSMPVDASCAVGACASSVASSPLLAAPTPAAPAQPPPPAGAQVPGDLVAAASPLPSSNPTTAAAHNSAEAVTTLWVAAVLNALLVYTLVVNG